METQNKDVFLKKCYSIECSAPLLSKLTKAIIIHNYSHYGLADQLNVILANAIPTDTKDFSILKEKGITTGSFINESLKYVVAVLHFAFSDESSERPIIVTELGNAFYALVKDGEDDTLDAFAQILIDHLEKINSLYHIEKNIRRNASLIIVCFARTLFEMQQFQGPSRLVIEHAIRYSRGETNLWREYLEEWKLLRYL